MPSINFITLVHYFWPAHIYCRHYLNNQSFSLDGKDYIHINATLTFNGTQSHHSINISIIEDQKAEGAEEFFGVLSILNNSDPRVQLKNPNITITIMANG